MGLPVELPRLLADILVPGWAFDGGGRRAIPVGLAVGWAFGLGLFVVLLGTPAGNAGLALAISLHAVSAGQGFVKLLQRQVLVLRMALGLALGAGLAGLAYLPASYWFCNHVALPLRTPRGVVIVNPRAPAGNIQRGDLIVLRYDGLNTGRNVVLHEGYVVNRVLAVGGDQVVFGPTEFSVNQQSLPRGEFMPETGGLTVRQGNWFIWPEIEVRRNTLGQATLTEVFLDLAVVSPSQFVGRPFEHWFFRTAKP